MKGGSRPSGLGFSHDTDDHPSHVTVAATQEWVLDRFASLLGVDPSKEDSLRPLDGTSIVAGVVRSPQWTAKEFSQCLSPTAVKENDVVCTLPSLNFNRLGDAGDSSHPLPALGKTQNGQQNEQPIPRMEASVLPSAEADTPIEEKSAEESLSEATCWTRSTLVHAPSTIAKNISNTIRRLLDSRTREWTILLLRRSLETGDASSRSLLLRVLSSKLEIKKVCTSFTTLPFPHEARPEPKDDEVVLPLLFEAVVHLSIQGQLDEKVTFRAAGTISGNFAKETTDSTPLGLRMVEIRLDTKNLLQSLVKEARLIVVKFVEHTTSVQKREVDETTKTSTTSHARDAVTAPTSLSQFSSALRLSSKPISADESPSLRKARSSAYRLNEVLHGRPSSPPKQATREQGLHTPMSKSRKTRSVTWNHPLEPPKKDSDNLPAGKKPKTVSPGARLRSIKSFGRPHADDLPGRPENATFAEFGRSAGDATIWGRDGRMRSHPKPGGPTPLWQAAMDGGSVSGSTKNAAFDVTRPNLKSFRGLSSKKSEPDENRSLPRTATAMETRLLNSSMIGEPPDPP